MKLELPAGATGGVAAIAYAYTGGKPFDARLPTVVLVHGALHDHSVWALAARWLAHHGFGVLAIDLPGHGRSAGPARQSVEAMADWLLAVLDAAGVAQATLVGHSMGSLVALELAARAPSRVGRLVLIGTASPMPVSAALLDTAANDPLAAMASVNAWSHSTLAAKPSHPAPGAWLHGGNLALMRRMQGGDTAGNLFLTDFRACDAYRGGSEAAARVRCPATVVVGRRDQMTTPQSAAALAAALRTTPVVVESGHALMTEAPDALLEVLRKVVAA